MSSGLRVRPGMTSAYVASLITAAAVTLASIIGLVRAAGGLYDTSEWILSPAPARAVGATLAGSQSWPTPA